MIKDKIVHFATYSTFAAKKLSADANNSSYTTGPTGTSTTGTPEISWGCLCLIKDTMQLWTHGKIYPNLSDLETDDTSTLVAAINEIFDTLDEEGKVTATALADLSERIDQGLAMDLVYLTGDTATLSPNKFYEWTDNPSTLTIVLEDPADETKVNEYMFQFTAGENFSMSIAPTVTWTGGSSFEEGNTYQVSILNSIAVCTSI